MGRVGCVIVGFSRHLLVNLEKMGFTKTCFLVIQVEIGEVWGCLGGAHGAYEDIPSNFYVRFLEFSVFQFLLSFFSLLA